MQLDLVLLIIHVYFKADALSTKVVNIMLKGENKLKDIL